MSTAIMSQNTLYDFGDSLIKNGMANPEAPGAHLAVGSTAVRLSLTRMASTPATSNVLAAALLDKFTQQHRRLERTQSAPAPTPNQPLSPASVNTSRYKTELCRPYEEFGVCKYGDKCQFAHGIGELRSLARHPKYKTELCRTFHSVGFCPYGPRCHFVHNQDEVLQKNPQVSALLARQCQTTNIVRPKPTALSPTRPTPTALSPTLSLDSPSPPSSLSQSPTSSLGSFFSSDPELHSPLPVEEQRLPVFNRLSAAEIFSLQDLMLH